MNRPLTRSPGSVASSDDRRHDVFEWQLRDGRNLLNRMVAVVDFLRRVGHEGARVAGQHADRLGRVDQQASHVLVQRRREHEHLQ